MTGRPQQQPGAGGSRNPRPSGGSSVDLRACSIIPAAQDSSLPGSWRRRSPTAACPLSVGAGRRQCPPQQPGVGPLNGLAPPWRLPRRSPGQQHHRDGQGQQPAGLVAVPFPHRRVPFACRCWPPAVPAAAARRWAVERPRAPLATPPLISGPAASSWRPRIAACRAGGRAGLAARWPWPPPRGAAHHALPLPRPTPTTHATPLLTSHLDLLPPPPPWLIIPVKRTALKSFNSYPT